MIIITPNFFNNFEYIKESFKKIPLYDMNEFNKKFSATDTWPGLRSSPLCSSAKFLTIFFCEMLQKHNLLMNPFDYRCELFIHLRLEKDQDKDWVHKDSCQHSAIVYLSDSNYNSGTCFYDEDKKTVVHKAGFVQNTCVFFNPKILHKSVLNYGTNINNGRLTLNAFFY